MLAQLSKVPYPHKPVLCVHYSTIAYVQLHWVLLHFVLPSYELSGRGCDLQRKVLTWPEQQNTFSVELN